MFVLQAHQVKNLPDVVGFSRSRCRGHKTRPASHGTVRNFTRKACGCGSFFADVLPQFLLEMWKIYRFLKILPKTGKCALHKASRDPFIPSGRPCRFRSRSGFGLEVAKPWSSYDGMMPSPRCWRKHAKLKWSQLWPGDTCHGIERWIWKNALGIYYIIYCIHFFYVR